MNLWLDSQFCAYGDDFRKIQLAAYSSFTEEPLHSVRERKRKQAFASAIYSERDLVHDHSGLACLVPKGTFRFTVLRNPVERLSSQLRDFRRLKPHNYAHHSPAIREIHSDISTLPLRQYLEKHARKNGPFRHFFDNYMVRAIAHNRVGVLCNDFHDASAFLQVAIETLEQDFEFVGLLEEEQKTREILAASLGWAPQNSWPVLNKNKAGSSSSEELEDARDILAELTAMDERLYSHARDLFEYSKKCVSDNTEASFERDFVSSRLNGMKAEYSEVGMMFDMRQPITGSGHLGRRTNQEGRSWVWTDAAQTFTLYMPTPPNRALTIFLRILEYGNDTFRDNLIVSIDGNPVEHRFAKGPKCKELLKLEHSSMQEYLRLDIGIKPDAMAGITGREGVRIDAYGWQ